MSRGFRVVLGLGVAAASTVGTLACTSVHWTGGPQVPYRMPQRFYLWVDVSEQARAANRLGAVTGLENALHRDIWRRGYDVDVVSSGDGRDRYPRIEVLVRQWRSGSEEVQFFKGFGEAQIDADCSVRLSPSVGPVFVGQLHARLDLSEYGPSPTGPFDAAADVIAEAVLGPNVHDRPAPAQSAPAPPASSPVAPAAAPVVLAAHPRPVASAPVATPTSPTAAPSATPSPPAASFPLAEPGSTASAVPTLSFPPE